jgi:sulfatase maturation enzyme AslB (radical SAM superfamily)
MVTLNPRTLSVEIEPTNLCNTQCVHCPHDAISRPVGKMDWETYQAILDKVIAFSEGTSDLWVGFAGMGEPLLNPLIYRFVEYAHGKATTMITSNASALTAQNMEKLIAAGLRILTISFNGHDKGLYELMMGGLNFERARKNLEAAKKICQGTSTEIQINLSVTRQTEGHIEEIRKYFLDQGIQNIIFSKCHNRGGFLKGDLICRTPMPPSHLSRCDIFGNNLFVAWNGDVLSCCHDLAGENRQGNLITDSIEGILSTKDKTVSQGTFFEICKHCNDFYRFADDQQTSGISISESVYDLYTGHLAANDGILTDTPMAEWLLATYIQEGKLPGLIKAINHKKDGETAALTLENQHLRNQLNEEMASLRLENQKLDDQLQEITHHRFWRIFKFMQKIRLFLIPKGSRREIIFQRFGVVKSPPLKR